MNAMTIALEIMGLGMLGIFTAMLVIMGITMLLGRLDAASVSKKTLRESVFVTD